jgi:hypothetical protein
MNASYSGFDSSVDGIENVEWLFPQEKTTLDAVEISRSESKPLYGIFRVAEAFSA